MTAFVYGTPDVSCAVGIAEPSEGGDPLPFFAFFKLSAIPEAELGGMREGANAMDMIKTVQQRGGVVVYFDNPKSADRIQKLMGIVFSAASRFEWSEKEELKGAMN